MVASPYIYLYIVGGLAIGSCVVIPFIYSYFDLCFFLLCFAPSWRRGFIFANQTLLSHL